MKGYLCIGGKVINLLQYYTFDHSVSPCLIRFDASVVFPHLEFNDL